MLYKLLIVDDEPFVLNHLVGLFGYQEKYELDVLRANSAVAALEILERHRVDIILSDIQMPRMDGLEFCNRVLSRWKDTKFVFLTAYQKFEHIYDAIKYGVIDFILKTESDDYILNVIGKVIEIIKNERKSSYETSLELYGREDNLFVIEDMIFKPLLVAGEIDHSILKLKLSSFNINIDPFGLFFLSLIRFDNLKDNYFTYETLQQLLKQINSIYRYYFNDTIEVITMISDSSYQNLRKPEIAVLLQPKDNVTVDFIHQTTETIQDSVIREVDDSITWCVGEQFIPVHELKTENELLGIILEHNKNLGSTILTGKTDYSDGFKNIIEKSFSFFDIKRQSYQRLFLSGEDSELIAIIKNIYDKYTEQQLKVELYLIISVIKNLAEGFNLTTIIDNFAGLTAEAIEPEMIFEDLNAAVYVIFRHVNALNSRHENVVVDKIKKFINDNISDDLSLENIADKLHYNPSYLSRLFSENTDTTISAYIKECRLNLIKKCLSDKNIMIKDICTMVGIESTNYLSRLFKKELGMSPKDYREKVLNG